MRTARGTLRRSEQPSPCLVVEVSLEGAQVLTGVELVQEDLLQLTFPSHILPLQMESRVVRAWRDPSEERPDLPFRAALAFTQSDDNRRSLIGQYVVARERNRASNGFGGLSKTSVREKLATRRVTARPA